MPMLPGDFNRAVKRPPPALKLTEKAALWPGKIAIIKRLNQLMQDIKRNRVDNAARLELKRRHAP